jgi:DNA-binding NarL/FixJ family response regulator
MRVHSVVATNFESSFDKFSAVWRVTHELIGKLSKQQREVFRMLGEAEPVKEIARKLKISPRSIETYVSRLKDALRLSNNAVLRRAAILHHISSKITPGASNLRQQTNGK